MANTLKQNWINRNLNWFRLRGFGQSKVASFSMATPFIGYVILYHEKFRPYLGDLGGLLNSPSINASCGPLVDFMTRLHMLFLGLLCLGIGTIIYRIFADQVIQSNTNISDYVDHELPNITVRILRVMFVKIRSRRPDLQTQFLDVAPWLNRDEVTLKAASEAYTRFDNESITRDVLRSYYTIMDRHNVRLGVYFSTSFFVIGFILLAIPSLAFTGRVLCAIFI